MRGKPCPKAWACRLLAKLPVPERVGSKVLPIPTKSLVFLMENKETLGEQQEPPRIHAGEVSDPDIRLFRCARKQVKQDGRPKPVPRQSAQQSPACATS